MDTPVHGDAAAPLLTVVLSVIGNFFTRGKDPADSGDRIPVALVTRMAKCFSTTMLR